jgi:O-antigen/teichoic acid export membrane protein
VTEAASVPADSSGHLPGRIAGAASSLLLRRAVLLVTSGLATVFVARLLGPAHYGQLQAALATWALLLAFSDFGFTLVLGRDLATRPDDRRDLLRAAFELQGIWSLVLAVGMAALGLLAGPTTERGALLLVLAPSVLVSAFTAGRTLFMATYQVGRTVRIDLVCNVVQVLAMVALAALGAGAVGVAAAISLSTIVNVAWIGWAAHRSLGGNVVRSPGQWRSLLGKVLPMGLMGVLSKVYLSIDLVILAFYVTGTPLGDYASAVKIVTLLNTVPGLLVAASLPGISQLMGRTADLRELLGKLMHWMAAAVLPLFVATALFPRLVLGSVLGDQYLGAATLVTLLAVAGTVGLLGQLLGTLLVAAGRVRPLLWQNGAAVVVNVSGNVLLIPHFGAMACAWLTVATEAIVCAGSWYSVSRGMGLCLPWRRSGRSFLVLAGAVAVAWAVPGPGWGSAVAGAVAYLVGTWAAGSWPPDLVYRGRFRPAA